MDAASLGNCGFCGQRGVKVWNVSVWADHFARLLDMYGESIDGSPIEFCVQRDWSLFAFDDPTLVRLFLMEAVGDTHPLLVSDGLLAAPRFEDAGAGADHMSTWDAFRTELIGSNRYFPSADLDLDYFKELVLGKQERLAEGTRLYRGRVCARSSPYDPSSMGAPPPNLVTGGRGNPVGIPHLYLASDIATCLKECRADFNGHASVAEFEAQAGLTYLDLVDLAPENPFVVDGDESNALVRSLVATQLLAEFGRELSVPTKPGENQIEYVPTQYLCEFVKSLGIHGIRYASSLHADGWNLVLFDPNDARVVEPVSLYEVTAMEFTFEEVGGPA